jgi:hypothetical protein
MYALLRESENAKNRKRRAQIAGYEFMSVAAKTETDCRQGRDFPVFLQKSGI